MADYGIKITKVTKDITSSTPEDYVFSTKFGTVKIVKDASSTVVVGASSNATVTIRHDLGFIPVALVYTEPTPSSGRWMMGCFFSQVEETYIDPSATYVDNINLVFNIVNSVASSRTVKYHYYIFADPI